MNTSKFYFNDLEINHIQKPKLKNSYISISNGEIYLKTSRVSKSYINELLLAKELWIRKKIVESMDKIYIDKDLLNVREAKDYMTKRIENLALSMKLEYSELKFRRMKKRWGSCSSKKIITLNIYLYLTDRELIDYVIIHELAHLVHMNHSKQFHSFVKSYSPNAKILNKKLNNYSCT